MTSENSQASLDMFASPEEAQAVLQQLVNAVCYLASVCDGAHSNDKHGFNGRDTNFGHAMANRITAGQSLSPNMIRSIGKMLQTYRKQLAAAGHDLPKMDAVHAYLAQLAPVTPEQKSAISFGASTLPGWITVKFPYAMLDVFKAKVLYLDRSWDKEMKVWHIRESVKDIVAGLAA